MNQPVLENYSKKHTLNFNFQWLESVLTVVFSYADLKELLRIYAISIDEVTIQKKDLIAIMLGDIDNDSLTERTIIKLEKDYDKKISYPVAQEIFEKLSKRSLKELACIYVDITSDNFLKNSILDSISSNIYRSLFKQSLLSYILNELYRTDKDIVLTFIVEGIL